MQEEGAIMHAHFPTGGFLFQLSREGGGTHKGLE